jgi:MFS transporter, FSR family, fosmidomycin resistance protein
MLLSLGHLIMDVNQGALPALLPFLIARHNLSYTAAAGIVFASNISSSLVQPLFGYFADRLSRSWLIPAGLIVGGSGFALTGVAPNYWFIFVVVALSGFGIAAFHPEAARLVNLVAGENKATAMSFFATGGYLGFALGPLFTTAILIIWGLKGTLFLMAPVTIMALLFAAAGRRFPVSRREEQGAAGKMSVGEGADAWGPFALLALIVISRSVVFFGLNTFLPLYWIHVLHQSKAAGGTALTILFAAGVIGSLLGGRCADRFGYRRVVLGGLSCLTVILPVLVLLQSVPLATLLLIPIGLTLFAPFSPMVVMGQKYLPNRVGLASGVTLGLAVSMGGIAAPLIGRIADLYGIHTAMTTIVLSPLVPTCLAFLLPRGEVLQSHSR